MASPPSSTKPDLRVIEGGDTRPEIEVTLELADMTDSAVKAIALDRQIYKRAGALVHVISRESAIPQGRKSLIIRELPPSVLGVRLAQSARWIKYDAKAGCFRRVAIPSSIVNAVYALGEWPEVRPLLAATNTPTMRPDGTVLQKKGYDVSTGLLYRPSRNFVEVPEAPTERDAKFAADAILDYACDFPFANPHDRSAWLALVLTLCARHAISGTCPLFAIDGNTPGVGKSRLVDLAHVIAYGTKCPRSSISPVPEEMRKQISSLLIEGVPAALFDNIDAGQKFGGPAFDALLTSDVWRDRELGRLAVKTLPARTVWTATGNNLLLAGDLTRRAVRMRLETTLDNPEKREGFRWGEGDNLFRAADRGRPLLVMHALTILRAHTIANPPRPITTWGSFESWVRTIVDPIRWLGFADPLLCRDSYGDTQLDTNIVAAGAMIDMLGSLRAVDVSTGKDGTRPITIRELLNELYPPHRFDGDLAPDASPTYAPARELLEMVTSARGVPDLGRVSAFLRKMRGRRISGKAIVCEKDPHLNIMRWTAR